MWHHTLPLPSQQLCAHHNNLTSDSTMELGSFLKATLQRASSSAAVTGQALGAMGMPHEQDQARRCEMSKNASRQHEPAPQACLTILGATCLHEAVKVVVVVEHFFSLLADVEDGVHGLHRVPPPQSLGPQQDAVHAVQHCVGHVRRLRPAPPSFAKGWWHRLTVTLDFCA